MKKSQFIIVAKKQSVGDEYLLYNTHNTAFVSLASEKYIEIFQNGDYSDDETVTALKNMGFLVEDDVDELKLLEVLRKKGMDDPVQNATILTTTNCNARCYYCFENGIDKHDMTEEIADAVIQYIKKNYPEPQFAINWFGGEPLLNFHIIEYLTSGLIAEGYELISHVTTNGSLLTPDMIDYFEREYSDLSFQITIDDVEGKYGRIKRYTDISCDLAYERVMKNVEELLRRKIKTNIRLNFAASQIDKAKDIYIRLKKRLENCDQSSLYIYFAPLTLDNSNEIISDFHGKMEHPFLQAVKLQYDEGFPLYAPRYEGDMGVLGSCGLMPNAFSCGMTTKNRIAISADGYLYKCHRLAGKKEYAVGTVFDGINESHPVYQMFRDTIIRDEQCKKCNILPICQGGCKSQRILFGDAQKCHRINQIQADLVRLYHQRMQINMMKGGNSNDDYA